MHFHKIFSRLFVLLVLMGFGFALQAQAPAIKQLEGTVQLSLSQDEAPLTNFGTIAPGEYVRQTFEARNNSEQTITLVRVLTDAGCLAIGRENSLRNIKLQPGESVKFDLMTNVQIPQDYSFTATSVVEVDGKRYRRAVFQWQGAVVEK